MDKSKIKYKIQILTMRRINIKTKPYEFYNNWIGWGWDFKKTLSYLRLGKMKWIRQYYL